MARNAVLKAFYNSKEWQRFRTIIIGERGLTCEECGKLIANPVDVILHHTPVELTVENVTNVEVALNPDNIKLVCFECHNKEHGRFGNPREKEVYIVYGCPLSGKTTFVRQNLQRGDLVVDMNELFEAITGLPAYDKPDSLLPNVRAVYNLLVDQVKTRYGKWGTAWIVGGFADKYKRKRLADELGAELIFCEISRDEAISRIDLDEHRRYFKTEYIKYIDDWFAKYME